MTTFHSKVAQTLFPLLTTALLAAGCGDSTGPGTDTDSTGPAKGGGTSASTPTQGAAPTPATAGLDEAPILTAAAPGDTSASSVTPSFYTTSGTWSNKTLAPGPGIVSIQNGAAQCMGGSWGRYLHLSSIYVVRSGGVSALYQQAITGRVWFYRYSGTSWVAVASAPLSANLSDLAAYTTDATLYPNQAGHYKVIIQMTWWANISGWIKAAGANYDLTAQSEYTGGLGSKTGPGYCTIY